MMPFMRTTLTLDDDVARALKELARVSGTSFKAVVNEMLRLGLTTGAKPAGTQEPFRVRSAARGFCAGVDPLQLNKLLDDLEVDRFMVQDHAAPSRE